MTDLQYLELNEIVSLHERLIERYGGITGFRGEEGKGLVQSALARPQNKAYYEGQDLFAQAASLFYGLAKNHGFLDGNKRIAVTATDVFLQINGRELSCDNKTLASFTEQCSNSDWTEEAVDAFVRQNVREI